MPALDKNKQLSDHGVFLLFDEIDSESMEDAVEFVLETNLNKSVEEITFVINSCGGSCMDGFALIDVMAGSKIPIRTVGVGALASMGLTIFIAGTAGKRVLTPNCSIMCHQWFGVNYGKEHELLAAAKHHKILSDMMVKHYKRHTGLTEQVIKDKLFPPHDVWLEAKEAKKLGLCDIIKQI